MIERDRYQASFNRVADLLALAYTRLEIEGALAALREHLTSYPADQEREIAHGLDRMIEALEEREAESLALGLSPQEHAERETLLKVAAAVVLRTEEPASLGRLQESRARLGSWLERHPDDAAARRRAEQLDREEELGNLLLASPAKAPVLAS